MMVAFLRNSRKHSGSVCIQLRNTLQQQRSSASADFKSRPRAYLLLRHDHTRWSDVVPLALGVPLAIGASRIALGKHWPTDVLGGFATGIAVGALTTANRRAHVVGNGKPIAG
jgi:hypothetical protein